MAEKNNATCSICGKNYYVCMSCMDSIKLHPFKKFTDTAEHYKVYQIVRGFSTGVYTKDEARSKFKNVDLSDLDSFRPHIKSIIEDILKEEKVVVKTTEKIKNAVVEDVKAEEIKIVVDFEKPTASRKRINKVEVENE